MSQGQGHDQGHTPKVKVIYPKDMTIDISPKVICPKDMTIDISPKVYMFQGIPRTYVPRSRSNIK
jgi:hypothetical protein